MIDSNPPDHWTAVRRELNPGLSVSRALPARGRRTVGAWCFFDHFGPTELSQGGGMDVAPHPHIGLQTVTWLFEGSLLHRDSLGHEQRIRPGALNLMTAGAEGIVHAERLPEDPGPRLHGVQLWVALPDGGRDIAPAFDHYDEVPSRGVDGGQLQVFLGRCGGLISPARTASPLVGAQIDLPAGATITLDVDERHEHALLLIAGAVDGDVTLRRPDEMQFVHAGRRDLHFIATDASRVILIGGSPLSHRIYMWWNFVSDDREAIRQAAQDWRAKRRFPRVMNDPGPRIEGPSLPDAY